jgi:hypothetical protein
MTTYTQNDTQTTIENLSYRLVWVSADGQSREVVQEFTEKPDAETIDAMWAYLEDEDMTHDERASYQCGEFLLEPFVQSLTID